MDAATRKRARDLGEAIRAGRRAFNLSQEDFAETCDLHRTYVGKVERGEVNVSLEILLKISAALRIRLSVLFDRAEM